VMERSSPPMISCSFSVPNSYKTFLKSSFQIYCNGLIQVFP
jgi:hypothetical protein